MTLLLLLLLHTFLSHALDLSPPLGCSPEFHDIARDIETELAAIEDIISRHEWTDDGRAKRFAPRSNATNVAVGRTIQDIKDIIGGEFNVKQAPTLAAFGIPIGEAEAIRRFFFINNRSKYKFLSLHRRRRPRFPHVPLWYPGNQ